MKKVYLAGTISGFDHAQSTDWRNVVKETLKDSGITAYSPLRNKHYLKDIGVIENAYDTVGDFKTPLSTTKGIVTRDHYDVISSDAVLVNLLNAPRASIGTMFEIAWAFENRIPVVTVMESDNIHRHPFVEECGGIIVEDLDVGVDMIISILND